MILATMNEAEISDELIKDLNDVVNYGEKKIKKIRRVVITSKIFPVYLHSSYISPRKNRWLMIWKSCSKKQSINKLDYKAFCIANFGKDGKKGAIRFDIGDEEKIFFAFYPPHFFSRYAERAKKNMIGDKLIYEYFRENFDLNYIVKNVPILDSNMTMPIMYGGSKEGVAMGRATEFSNILFRTFYTYEMYGNNVGNYDEFKEELTKIALSEKNKRMMKKINLYSLSRQGTAVLYAAAESKEEVKALAKKANYDISCLEIKLEGLDARDGDNEPIKKFINSHIMI